MSAIVNAPASPLTETEAERLAVLESIVDRHREGFVEVASALAEIKATKLYRAAHRTFEDYVQERFGFSKVHSARLRAAAKVVEATKPLLAEKVTRGLPALPERAIRETADLPVQQAAEVVATAVKKAASENRIATSTDVRKARAEAVPPHEKKRTRKGVVAGERMQAPTFIRRLGDIEVLVSELLAFAEKPQRGTPAFSPSEWLEIGQRAARVMSAAFRLTWRTASRHNAGDPAHRVQVKFRDGVASLVPEHQEVEE